MTSTQLDTNRAAVNTLRHFIRITFEDGDRLQTQINGTRREVILHYKRNNSFTAKHRKGELVRKIAFLNADGSVYDEHWYCF